MPVTWAGLAQVGVTAIVCHLRQTEIDAVGEYDSQQSIAVVGRWPPALMGEAVADDGKPIECPGFAKTRNIRDVRNLVRLCENPI